MHTLTKKRIKAVMIDATIANGLALVIEPVMRKKIKNEFFYMMVQPTVMFWGLEYVQLKWKGQTIGQKIEGIRMISEKGEELTSKQIIKRLVHRDFSASMKYLRNRKKYDAYQGTRFPHDIYAGTIIKEE